MKDKETKYSRIFSEIEINGLELKNRIALAPMTRTSAEKNGAPSDAMLSYYKRYAKGGFSLLISEGTYPDENFSQGYFHQPGIANEEHIKAWRRITETVHEAGAKMLCQIMHAEHYPREIYIQTKPKAHQP